MGAETQVELRGFEPLTPSMQTLANTIDGGRCRWSVVGAGHAWPVRDALAAARVAAFFQIANVRLSRGCAGLGKSTSAACAASMPLRSVREPRIVAVFPEPFVSTLLARSHNSMSVTAGGIATPAWSV